jgi:hypothetical protein
VYWQFGSKGVGLGAVSAPAYLGADCSYELE